jgi:hypothetical protein
LLKCGVSVGSVEFGTIFETSNKHRDMYQVNDKVYSKRFGNVTVTRVDGSVIYVDVQGSEKMMPASTVKPAKANSAPAKTKAMKDREEIARYKSKPQHLRIHSKLMAVQTARALRTPNATDYELYAELATEIMSKVNNQVVKLIFDTVTCLTITDKQAWLIAYACNEVVIDRA